MNILYLDRPGASSTTCWQCGRCGAFFGVWGKKPSPIALAGNALVAAVIVPLLLAFWAVGAVSFTLTGFLTGSIDGAADARGEAVSIIATRRW